MLVATGLVMMIMLMFAQIYGGAIGTITEQRGMANNDQKARVLTTVLRSDLQNMTYRQPAFPYGNVQGLVPIAPGDEPIIDPNNQLGYFCYSENNTNDQNDDVIQFTVQIRGGQRGNAESRNQVLPFVGRAANLEGGAVNSANEPEQDDGINGDTRGQSRAAEIAYFLRRGILYRRVLLIRDPLKQSINLPDQPSSATGVLEYDTHTGGRENYAGTNFYDDFDYSASRRTDDGGTSYLWFHSLASLDNRRGEGNFPLGIPNTRFGFALTTGLPVEFDSNSTFFGRFTHAETSDDTFLWPGQSPANNPYTRGDLTDTNPVDGVLDQYSNGSRIGEDIMLTNVESFDIELWDDAADSDGDGNVGPGDFVSIGSSSSARYADGQRTNTGYGSGVVGNRMWDSWHGDSVAGGDRDPPFRPLEVTSAASSWGASAAATAGSDILFPWAGEDLNLNRTLDGGEDLDGDMAIDRPWRFPNGSFRAVCVTSGTTGAVAPEWPPTPGAIVQDGTARWQIQDNRIGLKAIRITVRYRDVSSNLPRQLTIVHSFVE